MMINSNYLHVKNDLKVRTLEIKTHVNMIFTLDFTFNKTICHIFTYINTLLI